MLQTMVSLVDPQRTFHVKVHDALADIVVSALSAEPVTFEELRAALHRFVDPSVVDLCFAGPRDGIASEKTAGGHVLVDLTAELLLLDTPMGEMPRVGTVQACDAHTLIDLWLPYRIPDDWEVVETLGQWEAQAPARRTAVQDNRYQDHRAVLYGQLARALIKIWMGLEEGEDEPTQRAQATWLLSPRPDLRNRTPREILLAKHAFIEGDVQDQGETWRLRGVCPPGLSPTAHAYRFGGFGPHEVILYHEMVMYLLIECERRLRPRSVGEVEPHVRHLEQLQQEWLHQPQHALYDQSPAALIARERARLPAVVPKSHAAAHDDCPLCRMMYESGQPLIWQLDTFSLDHTFATSLCATREEWELAQQMWAAVRDQDDTCGGGPLPASLADLPRDAVWQHSHTNMRCFQDMPPREACAVMLFSIGGHMGELMQDLKEKPDGSDFIRQLHQRFDDLRVAVKDDEETWLLRSCANAFTELLHDVQQHRPDLHAKCADLEEKLDFLCRRYQEYSDEDLETAF